MYIYFVCDGIITHLWGRQDPKFANLLNINIYFRYAIQLGTTVAGMSFIGNYSTVVVEGAPFQSPPIIIVSGIIIKIIKFFLIFFIFLNNTFLDSSGNPVTNKLVIATMYISFGDILPYKYRRQGDGFNKDLIKPIPGHYNANYSDPFLDGAMMTPIYTNNSGIVVFTDLFFSGYGPAGTYIIEFDCEGTTLLTTYIYVVSIVSNIKIIIQPSAFITSDAGDIASQLNCLIQVVDKNGNFDSIF